VLEILGQDPLGVLVRLLHYKPVASLIPTYYIITTRILYEIRNFVLTLTIS
jgi:hypothetical protein